MPGVGTHTHTHTHGHYLPGKVDIKGTIQILGGGRGELFHYDKGRREGKEDYQYNGREEEKWVCGNPLLPVNLKFWFNK